MALSQSGRWLALAVAALAPLSVLAEEKGAESKMWVYVGTYTGGESKGIYRLEFDPGTGKLSNKVLAVETKDPSFLAIHPNKQFLYAVGEGSSSVAAFALDPKTGDLKPLNQQSSRGPPCHLVVDKAGKNVLAANYTGGSVCCLPIGEDGKLGEASAFIQHKGSSADPARQKAPHGHSINLDAANKFAFAADLGLDKVLVYKFDPARGLLTPNDPPAADVTPGSGPRHFAFHPDGKHAYVINEMALTVTAFGYDPEKGALKPIQTISTLPQGATGKGFSTAEVQVHPSGKFLYGSNRGHNTIVAYKIDPTTGQLTLVGHQGENIKTLRNFGIDPTGKFLLVANQDGSSIIVFRIDETSGELKPTGNSIDVPKPVCVKFVVR